MTIERSHSRLHVLRPRSRDLDAIDPLPIRAAGRDERGRFTSANAAANGRATKHALSGALRRVIQAGARSGMGPDASPPEATQTARAAVALYKRGVRELGSDSALVHSAVMRWAIGTATANALQLAALTAGVATSQGLALLERAEKQAQAAERSSVVAADLARALRGPASSPSTALERRAEQILAEQQQSGPK